jgi:CRP/FNR family transcriptional regulator, cyclic AMP receptor protein
METVLLIEDNKDIRENMGEILELARYNVLLAANGKEGVELATKHLPDIIVCDIMMPELDGYGVIHLLQKNEDTKNIPFIFLTAKTERSEIRKGMELGADDYITKPFEGTELLNAITTRLAKAKAQRAAFPEQSTEAAELRSIDQVFEEEADVATYSKKQIIYSERNHAYRLYRVVTGKVKTYKLNDEGKELITGLYNEGDYFGYLALLEGSDYKEYAAAIEESEIASVPKEAFVQVMEASNEELRRFIRMLAGNVAAREEQLLNMAYNSLRRKVAAALMQLSQKYKTNPQLQFEMQISRENLAAIAGTAKESLIRTLSDFKEEGLVQLKGSMITILNEKKLAGMAN